MLPLAVIYGIVAWSGFFAPQDSAEQDRERPYAPPIRIHWIDAKGSFHFRPFFYGQQLRAGSFDRYEERTDQVIPIRFWREGAQYRLFGLLPSGSHLFVEENERSFSLRVDRFGPPVLIH